MDLNMSFAPFYANIFTVAADVRTHAWVCVCARVLDEMQADG